MQSRSKRLCTLAAFMLATGIGLQAQISKTVSVNLENSDLKTLFQTLQKQTGCVFSYSDDILNQGGTVSIKMQAPASKVLSTVLNSKNLSFKQVSDKSILIVPGKAQSEAKVETKAEAVSGKKSVTGVVLDQAGEPCIGATVFVQGTKLGASTDLDGKFSLAGIKNGAVVKVTYVGCKPYIFKVGNDTEYICKLEEENQKLDELVVIGYGVAKKRDVSTAISQIKGDELANRPNADFRQSMAGKMPGVSVMQTSGNPEGDNLMVRVRGVGSITAGNEPLYIVDGVPMENGISNLNPNDIESLEVLKDASAAAIYGSRGSNGVIIITTRKGKTERAKVSYDGYFAWDKVSKKIALMNAYENALIIKEAHDGAYYDLHPGGTDPNGKRPESYSNWPVEIDPYLAGVQGLTDTDWQDAIFRTGQGMNHNLAVSGKTATTNYFISGSFLHKDGIIINSDTEKYNFRVNLDGHVDRLKFGVNMAPSYQYSNKVNADGPYSDGGVVQSALAMHPMFPVYNADGTFNFQGNGYFRVGTFDYQHNEILNPVALATLNKDKVSKFTFVGRAYMGLDLGKGFQIQTSLGGNFYGANERKYRPSELPKLGKSYYLSPSNPIAESSNRTFYNWLWENQLTYNRTFGEHSLNGVLVQSVQKETATKLWVTATDFPNDYIQTISGGTVSSGTDATEQWSLASYIARAQYNYSGKYMLSAALRADGSSRFGKNNRWGYFPSASAAWRFSGENFMENLGWTWFNDGKLRASYGKTGNFNIGNYQHLSTMSSDDYILGSGSGTLNAGYKPDGIANDDLTWEKTSMVNFGIDLAAFNGYIRGSVEYYTADTNDMLLNVPVPRPTGYQNTLLNIGQVNNRGWEVSLSSTHSYSNGFNYSFSANWAKNTNEVKKLGANDTPIITTVTGVDHAYYITQVGGAIGSYYLLVKDGIFKNEDELRSYPHFADTKPGDFRFVDVDGDGVLDIEKDRTVVGNYMPDFTYGINGSIGYKGIDVAFAFQGVYGSEILNLTRRYLDNMQGNQNGTKLQLDRWQSAENPGSGEVNRANRKQSGYNARTSTWVIEDGSYFRLQNLAIGYTLPSKLTRKVFIDKCRFYVSANNLYTWTKYSGYNPECSNSSNALTPGIDYGTYPLARTLMFGVNITTF